MLYAFNSVGLDRGFFHTTDLLGGAPAPWGAAPGRTDPPAAIPSGTLLEGAFCDLSAVSVCPAGRVDWKRDPRLVEVDASASVGHVSADSS